MPAKYSVYNDGKLVIERWSGRVSHEELIRHVMRRVHDQSIAPGATVLADGRSARFESPEEKAQSIADTHAVADDRMRKARVAMIVNKDVLVRANMLAVAASRYGLNIMVFEHFDVGCLWLDLKPSDVARMLDELDVTGAESDSQAVS